MENFSKIVRIGKGAEGNVFCNIKFFDGKLSITGVEGPKRNGDCVGACGQIVMHEWDIKQYAPGWSAELVQEFRKIWNAHHLNDMQAGSPAQTAFLDSAPNIRDYTERCAALKAANLNPDPSYMHNGKPYSYGSAWLKREVPAEAITFLQSLPETDMTPAWV